MSSLLFLNQREKVVMEEMIRGQEIAIRLKAILPESSPGEAVAGPLVDELLNSFSKAFSVFDVKDCGRDKMDATAAGSLSSETSGKKKKISSKKHALGGHKRRQPHAWKTAPSEKIDDGHTWRKFGQKEIQNTKFPRSYFRCSYRHSQGCQATKQAQRSEDNPSMFNIAYIGEHTCRDMTKASELIRDSSPNKPHLITFAPNITNNCQGMSLSSSLPALMHEDEELRSNPTPGNSPAESFMLRDLIGFEESPAMNQAMEATNEHGGAISGFHSPDKSLEMVSLMVDSFGYDNIFGFDRDDNFF